MSPYYDGMISSGLIFFLPTIALIRRRIPSIILQIKEERQNGEHTTRTLWRYSVGNVLPASILALMAATVLDLAVNVYLNSSYPDKYHLLGKNKEHEPLWKNSSCISEHVPFYANTCKLQLTN